MPIHDGVRLRHKSWKSLVLQSFSADKQSGKRLFKASPRGEAADGRTPGGLAPSEKVETWRHQKGSCEGCRGRASRELIAKA